jgi:ribosomal protein S8
LNPNGSQDMSSVNEHEFVSFFTEKSDQAVLNVLSYETFVEGFNF